MPNEIEAEITRLLDELADGNEAVKDELFACVYRELHQKAKGFMFHEYAERSWRRPISCRNSAFAFSAGAYGRAIDRSSSASQRI